MSENGEKRMEGKKKQCYEEEDEGQERVGKEKQRKKAKEMRWMK